MRHVLKYKMNYLGPETVPRVQPIIFIASNYFSVLADFIPCYISEIIRSIKRYMYIKISFIYMHDV